VTVAGIVLAAGRSARTGFAKALAEIDGEPLVARAVRTLLEGGVPNVVVVVAPPHGAEIALAVPAVRLAENPAPERGMTSSLAIGIASAIAAWPDTSVLFFSLVDHPRVRKETVRRLVEEAERRSVPALRPTYDGRGGHPVVLSRRVADHLRDADATATIRDAIAAMGGMVDIEVDDPGVREDADTVEALRAIGARPPGS
jgi:molybdenum cofactor cytidylyltransferase